MTTRAALPSLASARVTGLFEGGERSGPWRVELKVIEEGDPSLALNNLRAKIRGDRGFLPPGTYTGLFHDKRGIVMSDVPDEMRDLFEILFEGRGRVVVNGLGLGCVVRGLLAKKEVTHIDVVEIDPDVIALTGPKLEAIADGRLTIHQGDAFTFKWPRGTRWNCAWHDVWDTLNIDNLSDEEHSRPGTYARLNRRYGQRVDWQGAWGQEYLQYQRRRGF